MADIESVHAFCGRLTRAIGHLNARFATLVFVVLVCLAVHFHPLAQLAAEG
jgi:hypothetical protein